MNPNTNVGECRQVWLQWRVSRCCAHCGSDKHIQADHCRGGKKVENCSSYRWLYGGPKAQQRELDETTPVHVLPDPASLEEQGGEWNHEASVLHTPAENRQRLFTWARARRPHPRSPRRTCSASTGPTETGPILSNAVASFAPRPKCKLECCMCHQERRGEQKSSRGA